MYSTQKNITDIVPQTSEDTVTCRYIKYPDNTSKRQAEGGLRLQNKYKNSIEKKPLVSVITICFNNYAGLEETIKSVINQTYDNIEYIVVDGGSTDGTFEVLKKYEHAIDYFISEPDTGIYNAMNKGIGLSSGTWLNFMNSGDTFYSDDVLENLFYNNFDGVDIIYGSLYVDKGNEKIVVALPDILEKDFLIKDTLPHQASLIRSKCFNLYGLYSEKYKISSDYEKWCIFIIKNGCKCKKVDIIVAKYNFDGISSNINNLPIIYKEKMKILSSIYGSRKAKEYIKNPTGKNSTTRIGLFLKHLFSVRVEEKFVVIYLFSVKISIKRNYTNI